MARKTLRDGMDDNGFKAIFKSVMQKVMDVYQPGAVVLQCGADSLAADRLAGAVHPYIHPFARRICTTATLTRVFPFFFSTIR